jgi:large subunit ribosomal protein L20
MTRVKSKARISHKKVMKMAKGYKNARSRRFKAANEAVMHAGQYAYEGRKIRKRNLRSLWIIRIGAALKQRGLSYSKFIKMLKTKNVALDRKILADIAVNDPETFEKIVAEIK